MKKEYVLTMKKKDTVDFDSDAGLNTEKRKTINKKMKTNIETRCQKKQEKCNQR